MSAAALILSRLAGYGEGLSNGFRAAAINHKETWVVDELGFAPNPICRIGCQALPSSSRASWAHGDPSQPGSPIAANND